MTKIGLFFPSASNGSIVSTTSPPFVPTFDNLLDITQKAENHGVDFGLAMVKLHGFGGPSRFWDISLDPFTLVSALLARTKKIKLFATSPILAVPPALAARAAATIDSVSPGRFGINIVTGWARSEYDSMGLWPGDEHYKRRYEYGAEYVTVLQQLWATGRSDFQGQFFKLNDCRVEPMPAGHVDIVSAGQSDAGLNFAAQYADYSFSPSVGTNNPAGIATLMERVKQAKEAAGRTSGSFVTILTVPAETDEEAWEKWRIYSDGIDTEALAWAARQGSGDAKGSTGRAMAEAKPDVAMGQGRFIGSYKNVAGMLDELAAVPGLSGIMLVLDNWHTGVDEFGTKIQPLMKSRR